MKKVPSVKIESLYCERKRKRKKGKSGAGEICRSRNWEKMRQSNDEERVRSIDDPGGAVD